MVKTKLRLTGNWLRLRNLVYDRNYAYASPVDLACTGEPLHVLGDDIELRGLEVRNGNQSGIFLGGADRATIEGNWIHDNGTHANADHGIYWSSGSGGTIANNVIERNLVYGIQMYPSPTGQLITQNTLVANGRAGIVLSGASNVVVVNNISAWNREEGIRTGSGSNSGCRRRAERPLRQLGRLLLADASHRHLDHSRGSILRQPGSGELPPCSRESRGRRRGQPLLDLRPTTTARLAHRSGARHRRVRASHVARSHARGRRRSRACSPQVEA